MEAAISARTTKNYLCKELTNESMAKVEWSKTSGIAWMSGRLGNLIFYVRGGKQYVKRAIKPVKKSVRPDNGPIMVR